MPVKLLIIGEAWGVREAMFEHAFVGSSGQELMRMLDEAKVFPKLGQKFPSEFEMIKYWAAAKAAGIEITNVFNSRPADNDVEQYFANKTSGGLTSYPALRKGLYVKPEMAFVVPDLLAKINDLAPNLILALGNTACWAVLGQTRIGSLRGTIQRVPGTEIKVLPTFHPSSVLRQWNQRVIVVSDLEKAAREMEFGQIRRKERWLTISPTIADIEEWITRPAEYYAVDIENPYKAISMIGFARSASDALVIPFFNPDAPDGNYWPDVASEVRALQLCAQLLSSPVPKVFQNGIYDLSHLLPFGYRPANCMGDTMLLHHALYPEQLKGLGFLGSIYSDEIAWKTMRTGGNNLKRDE